MTGKDLDTRTNEDPEGFAAKGARKKSPHLLAGIFCAMVAVGLALHVYRSPNDVTEEKNKMRADYCQMMQDRHGPQILAEIYAPGTEQTCNAFLANYQED